MNETRSAVPPPDSSNQNVPTILLIAASRGLGLAMAAEFLKKGWNVVGTVRTGSGRTKLHDLADQFKGRLEIETLDICEQTQVTALRERLSGRTFEMLLGSIDI
jgi:NAD(P)-dependent dehydrogenase (short-subunit alcohol dehydrogenase family)